ncbi:ATPase, T2SS/T4P/T4SS family [Pleionea litopenaei]|uniref:ATPase, T2SS/T4P/T4SS family n=1 Tax=Pleionea litopenaei TaxID=3070815 RepID=A0AA51X6W2_9GAMM|nr:ATPase, T2SS/T4P/T4SS family [Pleionea sp. HL-JVS1]WMS87251.1 ATPase, T2SS/T4P/T4SS family [Pleionea sp. HL-JVS1]
MFQVSVRTSKGTKVADLVCTEDVCLVGKDAECFVNLHGWKVAKEHAKLTQTDNGIYIQDLGSKLGTLVNGNKVTQFGPLTEADEIEIHSYKIKIKGGQRSTSKKETSSPSPETSSVVNSLPVESIQKTVTETISHPAEQILADIDKEKSDIDTAANLDLDGQSKSLSDTEHADNVRQWRSRVHADLLKQMDLRRINVNSMSDEELREMTRKMIDDIVNNFTDLPSAINKQELSNQVLDEAVGLGPLETLIAMDDVSEIMVNAADEIFYEKSGNLFKSDVTFTDDRAVLSAIERIVTPLGRRIDESSPAVDARLKDGSRVNAVIPPIALKGPCITIRKFMKERLTAQHLVGFGSISNEMVKFVETAVTNKQNIVISGGTGSGKTTLLNVMSNFIPDNERIITVEDAAELKLYQSNLISLEARPPNQEGKGAVPIRELVKNCLRMRPDRIVVGECRGGEALDMLQAMNTGHDGSLTTAHANSPRDCISRLEVMVMMAGMDLPIIAIREQISSAVNIIVQQTRFACGTRKVTSIAEVSGVEGNRVQLGEIFKFKQTGFDSKGKVKGHFEATGIVPQFYENLAKRGIAVDMEIFSTGRVME